MSTLSTAIPTSPELRLAGTVTGAAPGYITPKAQLDELRRRRRVRRMMRDLDRGKWRDVLLTLQTSQFAWPKMQRHGGTIGELLVKVNYVRLAFIMHATVLVGTMPTISVPDGFEGHRTFLSDLSRRNAVEGLLHSTARKMNVEAEAAIRVDLYGEGVALHLEDNDITLPVGPDGPDGQPTVWERRWVIERPNPLNPRKPRRFLRVERHRMMGRAAIEQECYETDSTEVLTPLEDLRRVELSAAGIEGQDLTETASGRPLITRFVADYYDNRPQPSIQENDLDIVDSVCAAMTRLARTHAIHARPKVRVPESMVDKRTGEVDLTLDALIDPEKQFEYVVSDLQLEQMLAFMDRHTGHFLTMLEVSPALIGTKIGGGAAPDSFDKLRLESTTTLSRGRRGATYFGPALAATLTTASEIDSALPLRGYALGPVSVRMRPELPKDLVDLGRELAELRREGLVGHRTALARLHGEDQADAMLEEIRADQDQDARQQQAALFGAVGGGDA